ARQFQPEVVAIANDAYYFTLKEALADLPIKVFSGSESIAQIAEMETVDVVLTAMVGYSGLLPTLKALKAGKKIALANKETMVVAGELVCELAQRYHSPIIPVDSEHSAIFQCLTGEVGNDIEKIILTASGGPFRNKELSYLQSVTKREALKHPNWDMGAKITIDSASMMNKGFEVIEAKWLFGLTPEQIDVVVHPQSIIHSMVQFADGAVKAQMGLPDMKLPILYAFSYPDRLKTDYPRLNFADYPQLTFEKPDMTKFRNLSFAYDAMQRKGNAACILNAANEIVVAAFLQDAIGFLQMSDVIEATMAKVSFMLQPAYEDYVATDTEARAVASELVGKYC
ncbi:MAG: 1-deoxy-D-xylulose-5-phosphate reductoisomerase, partial [Bacteroidota bacterium]|nr:1-deoxy-D-xylulose-5-phosphate reductoisomerase [Bacteroidota bacterium]